MSKSLITFIAIVFLAGAAVDADNIYNRLFPEVKIVEYRREVRPRDTLLRRQEMDDRPFSVTLVKDDWNLVLTVLEICKEDGSALMEYEIECIIRGIKSDLDSQGF